MQIQLLERRMMSKSISISAKFQSKTFNKKQTKMIDKQANIKCSNQIDSMKKHTNNGSKQINATNKQTNI